jgi:hypothetical protein
VSRSSKDGHGAGDHFIQAERLRDVVVCAERVDLVFDQALRRQDDDRRPEALFAETPAYLHAFDVRSAQSRMIRVEALKGREGLVAATCPFDLVASYRSAVASASAMVRSSSTTRIADAKPGAGAGRAVEGAARTGRASLAVATSSP